MTLMEMAVVMAVMVIFLALVSNVYLTLMRNWAMESSYVVLSSAVRNAISATCEELALTTLSDNDSVAPPVRGLRIEGDESSSVVFQKPLVADGSQWSNPITIRLRNEDSDGDLRLDAGEDVDLNGILDRVVERLVDLNGDDDFDDIGEVRVLARDIDTLIFSLSGSRLDISLRGRRMPGIRTETPLTHTETYSIMIAN